MNLTRIKLIAIKETHDHVTSLRFLGLLFLLIALCTIQVFSEIGNYFSLVDYYANAPFAPADLVYALSNIPYSLSIFEGIRGSIEIGIYGPIIAIAFGFDLVTKEREAGTLKTMLSVPVYRDEVINGKVLGGIIVIILATTILFALEFAILLLNSIVPDTSELSYFFAFWAITNLYLSGIFIMSVMISTIAKSSGMSLIISLLTLLVLTTMVFTIGSFAANYVISDPVKEYKGLDDNDPVLYEMSLAYNEKKENIIQIASYLSYRRNYHKISDVLLRSQSISPDEDPGNFDRTLPPVREALAPMWGYILFLIAYPAVFFGIAYVRFMRMDLR
ncbi:ABC transporter permease subunit [Methanogenium organophilum]|uniref:ABC transporter permease subunit n=1 Tax=Methanogenium organophilum TaxID=2199 RepID=A0A9X9S3Q5_METOG|nr:ABC transporter permease subunit [Methanogenium organophilum]WAI01394.1 ABC transporter permease subunit [Methanogenium organophilum]